MVWNKVEQLGTKGYEKVQFPYPGVKRFESIEGFKKFQKLWARTKTEKWNWNDGNRRQIVDFIADDVISDSKTVLKNIQKIAINRFWITAI